MKEKEIMEKYFSDKDSSAELGKFIKWLSDKKIKRGVAHFACENGNLISILHEALPECEAIGVVTNNKKLLALNEEYPDIIFCDQKSFWKNYKNLSAVVVTDLLPAKDEIKIMSKIRRVLEPGAYLCIEFHAEIIDAEGNSVYSKDRSYFKQLISDFIVKRQREYLRQDNYPTPHEHVVYQYILQKQ